MGLALVLSQHRIRQQLRGATAGGVDRHGVIARSMDYQDGNGDALPHS